MGMAGCESLEPASRCCCFARCTCCSRHPAGPVGSLPLTPACWSSLLSTPGPEPLQDLVQEVFTHLEALAKHVGAAAAEILQRMPLSALQTIMSEWASQCMSGVQAGTGQDTNMSCAARVQQDHLATASEVCIALIWVAPWCSVPAPPTAARYRMVCPDCTDRRSSMLHVMYRMALPLR